MLLCPEESGCQLLGAEAHHGLVKRRPQAQRNLAPCGSSLGFLFSPGLGRNQVVSVAAGVRDVPQGHRQAEARGPPCVWWRLKARVSTVPP